MEMSGELSKIWTFVFRLVSWYVHEPNAGKRLVSRSNVANDK